MAGRLLTCFIVAVFLSGPAVGAAHFLELIPDTDIVVAKKGARVTFDIRFSHPMEGGPLMNLEEPEQFRVTNKGISKDLKPALITHYSQGNKFYQAEYLIDSPGDHVFTLTPQPYWEPAEQKMIIHYPKVIINAFGDESGWDEQLRLPVEIDPLVRPYGLWAGNTFRGVVKKAGRPVPFAEVEVEYLNKSNTVKAPSDPFITQVILTDINGVFSYTMPIAGWWGFAALVEGDELMVNPEGEKVEVELGGLLWVHCVDILPLSADSR